MWRGRWAVEIVVAGVVAAAPCAGTATGEPVGEGGPNVVTNSVGMRLVRMPAGRFLMGSGDDTDHTGEEDERPRHEVVITRPFLLGACEVTQREYERVVGENPSWFGPHGPGALEIVGQEASRHPVDRVTWDEAVEFCRRLSELPEERQAGRVYRLPTEAEWEYACRAGSSSAFHSGDVLRPGEARFRVLEDAARCTAPVGSFPANAFGLHDMHGNVWEWCADRYRFDAYDAKAAVDPAGPEGGTGRVVRGGAWNFGPEHCRSANRDFTRQTRRDIGNGFRVVCEIRQAPAE